MHAAALDPATLVVVRLAVEVLLLFVMATAWQINREERAAGWWLLAALAGALAAAAGPACAAAGLPRAWGEGVAVAGSLTAWTLDLHGALVFAGRRAAHRRRWVLLSAIAFALLGVAVAGHPVRRDLAHDGLAAGLLAATTVALLWRSTGLERVVRGLAALAAAAGAAACLTRAGFALVSADGAALDAHPVQAVVGLVLTLAALLWTSAVALACYQRAQGRLSTHALEDDLTGLPNRRAFDAALRREIERCKRGNPGFAVLQFDLDGTKEVNDRLGRDAGDALLVEAARRLRRSARAADYVARLGGDEFVALIADVPDHELLERVVARLRAAVDGPIEVLGRPLRVRTSLGGGVYAVDGLEPAVLLRAADARLRADKAAHRGAPAAA